jgi:hypothetical protein
MTALSPFFLQTLQILIEKFIGYDAHHTHQFTTSLNLKGAVRRITG